MCGIFAMFLKRPLQADDLDKARRATSALAHRGPDAQGEWIDESAGVFLGHRRLSIIDLSAASNQPFRDAGLTLTFNGEIYNYKSIRSRLQDRGIQFSTSGDVEVLLKSWATHGSAALDGLDGMFAFALWDGRCAQVAVDPFGEKPLYLAETESGVYLASELPPLIEILQPAPALASDDLLAFLALGYLPSPRTAWQGIRRLPGGHRATISEGRVDSIQSYWRPALHPVPSGKVENLSESDLDRFRDALLVSLEGRYVADVPVCLFLSAGIDSSLIAALSVYELGRRPSCVTVAFSDSSVTDEAPIAAQIANHMDLPHRRIESRGDPTAVDDNQFLDLIGQVNDNLTALSIRQMCAAVRDQFSVGLTGMGGDEVFFGYGKHHLLYRHRLWRRLPAVLRRTLGYACATGSKLLGRDGNHLRALTAPDHELYLSLKNAGAFDWLRQQDGLSSWARELFDWPGENAYMKAAWYEIAENMQCSQLPAIDHGSMRASMELRTPFLNRRLVDLVSEFDPRAFMALEQKAVLRRLLKRYLPDNLVDRPKAGFRFPPDQFVSTRQQPDLSDHGISDARVTEAWARRGDGPNWARICTRLALVEAFAARSGKVEQKSLGREGRGRPGQPAGQAIGC